jgi:hypothetical protein
MKRTVVVVLVLALGLGVGCRRSVTVTGKDGSSATITESRGGVEINVRGKDGQTVKIAGGGRSAALPEDFPKDVAIYAGAKPVASVTAGKGMQVTLQTGDAVDKVAAFYKAQLKTDGWEIQGTVDQAEGTMLTCVKESEKRQLLVTVAHGDDGTMVSLMVSKDE